MSASLTETSSPAFRARHEERDAADVAELLAMLEGARERVGAALPGDPPAGLDVVVHASAAQLALANPVLPLLRRATAPAARRYVAGWVTQREIHILAPRLLRERASNVPGSQDMLLLTPAALYAQLAVAAANPRLPPPLRPRALRALLPWAWLALGSGQWLSGQTAHARPAIARRLREGARPAFPPRLADAWLLGGSVLELLAREEGERAVVRLALGAEGDPRRALEAAFGGRPLVHSEGAWRSHLARVAGAA
jgi:hypothetical protein